MRLKNDSVKVSRIAVEGIDGHRIKVLVIRPSADSGEKKAGVMWIHGGGYYSGMKEMAYVSYAVSVVEKFGVTVFSPGYRLSFQKPFPAALNDCYSTLLYMKNRAEEEKIRSDQLFVGGESAGGGLAAAVCMFARDKGEVNVAYQMPLYPMLDDFDTPSSSDNHAFPWNTRRNHRGWKLYLRDNPESKMSPYASPARQDDYACLPPAYTFVGDGEPFYSETVTYIDNLREAGVEASIDVYHTDFHAFDMLRPNLEISKTARERFLEHFDYALSNYFAAQ